LKGGLCGFGPKQFYAAAAQPAEMGRKPTGRFRESAGWAVCPKAYDIIRAIRQLYASSLTPLYSILLRDSMLVDLS